MILKILQEPHKILRETAQEIKPEEIKSKGLQDLLKDMSQTLAAIDIGVGLAAPQVGKPLRIFLVSEEALAAKRDKRQTQKNWKHLVFINPEITRRSREKELLSEGCLSADKLYGRIERAKRVVVQAYNEEGKKFRRSASGLFAQVIQHETDHLNGILFIDKAKNLKRLDEKAENGADEN
ncbi:peptide deformylase [Candidatus Giovannonibacteria bacterium RIFCSPHIGHO2_01_FULL_48_47]|nr:MAG: peptide deformylase [Candidatus Giovannonibacteria bacterium RIFCSPHIGHO2_01_FULL_48_47]OGF67902.1 MAG: peptide deformylase [Candidatus Giovannonibacteria bacterium RIFCSPHIGHO2_02_FULL_48_15]OGF88916.1 MAG: peptide deformylase [Candidatus Giovannonibacteria bacterium RIFCSPLOWO2_01_FULL_48_47]OGF95399.1 MAG: peptide deformylase [Candidatus Giovannonibacteria bacterium RIFOXYC1_FULL_48_8]OGF96027.1 MAG: peptide deformylase [Candidatus Giovannonibacteria bacterium RIFOXYD1_FULL_48_21]HB